MGWLGSKQCGSNIAHDLSYRKSDETAVSYSFPLHLSLMYYIVMH